MVVRAGTALPTPCPSSHCHGRHRRLPYFYEDALGAVSRHLLQFELILKEGSLVLYVHLYPVDVAHSHAPLLPQKDHYLPVGCPHCHQQEPKPSCKAFHTQDRCLGDRSHLLYHPSSQSCCIGPSPPQGTSLANTGTSSAFLEREISQYGGSCGCSSFETWD